MAVLVEFNKLYQESKDYGEIYKYAEYIPTAQKQSKIRRIFITFPRFYKKNIRKNGEKIRITYVKPFTIFEELNLSMILKDEFGYPIINNDFALFTDAAAEKLCLIAPKIKKENKINA